MVQARYDRGTSVLRLSQLIHDPVVRSAFERAERDYGQTFAIPANPQPTLNGGVAEPLPDVDEVVS